MRSVAELEKQLAGMTDETEFVEQVHAHVDVLLATKCSVPCAKQVRRASAFLCHAIRCVRRSAAAVGCLARPFTRKRTLTNGKVFNVGKVLWARPTLLASGSFATLVGLLSRLGMKSKRVVKFKGPIRAYEEAALLYPEWCGRKGRTNA